MRKNEGSFRLDILVDNYNRRHNNHVQYLERLFEGFERFDKTLLLLYTWFQVRLWKRKNLKCFGNMGC